MNCRFCGREFTVYEGDLNLYEKLSPVIGGVRCDIPVPTFCRGCRDRRHFAFRNERSLHRRPSSLSGEMIISAFNERSPFKVYGHDEWWSDKWDPMDFGRDFDFGVGFFEQFYVLQLDVPRPALINNKAENSDYCNFADGNKNCYLITSANWNEDSYYCWLMANSKDVVDGLWVMSGELIYECVNCIGSYNLKFCQDSDNCRDGAFLFGCNGVSNSMFCVNLKSKSYHLYNKPCSKEKYEDFLKQLGGSYKIYQAAIKRFGDLKKTFSLRKANNFLNCENCSGNNLANCRNVHESFDVTTSEDIRYSHYGLDSKDCSDVSFFDKCELCYDSTSLMGYGYRFTVYCRDSVDLIYCDNCHACKNCFGCVGLRNKQYFIFNKQYSKEGYEKLVLRIIEHMRRTEEWGEFFPIQYSVYEYNETIAQDFFPITREEAVKNGWRWYEDEKEIDRADGSYILPDRVADTDEEVCKQVLKCEVTHRSYKIIPAELKFYKKMSLPLPRKCPEQRFKERLLLRLPEELFGRRCAKCGVEMKTPYDPSRADFSALQVCCEKCYLGEVY